MLSDKIEARKSFLNGIGLFAKSDIRAGEIVWWMDKSVISFQLSDLDNTPKRLADFILKYIGSYGKTVILDTDQAIFMNHSCTPNVKLTRDGFLEVAISDIPKGMELLVDYMDFEVNRDLGFRCLCSRCSTT